MPTARCSCSSLKAGPRLFAIGGVAQGPSQAVEALCLHDGVWMPDGTCPQEQFCARSGCLWFLSLLRKLTVALWDEGDTGQGT